MYRTSFYRTFALALSITALFSACSPKDTKEDDQGQTYVKVDSVPVNLAIESDIASDQAAALKETVSALFRVPRDKNDWGSIQLSVLMNNTDGSPAGLQSWLESRVHYIVKDEFDVDAHASYAAQTFTYQFPNLFPDVLGVPDSPAEPSTPAPETPVTPPTEPPVPPLEPLSPVAPVAPVVPTTPTFESGTAQVVMSNVGTSIYAYGKQKHQLINVEIPGVGTVSMTSPRTGILEIGPGLFPDLGDMKLQNIALDIYRLGSLFHEARHSDGHGHTLGFMHSTCPAGHDFAGLPACDAALNGPYSVGAAVLKSMMNRCNSDATCTERSRAVLNTIYLDQANRVLDRSSAPQNLSSDAKAGMNWDDEPEGTR
jgi:hypothetical protein